MALLLITTSQHNILFQKRDAYISNILEFQEHIMKCHGESIDYVDCDMQIQRSSDHDGSYKLDLFEIDFKVLFYSDLKLFKNKFIKNLPKHIFGFPKLYNLDVDKVKIEYFKLPSKYISDKYLNGPLQHGNLKLYNFEKEEAFERERMEEYEKGLDLADDYKNTEYIKLSDFVFKHYHDFILEIHNLNDL